MMKKILLLCSLFAISFFANAQKKQNTYLLKNNNKEVFNRDSADFIRIIEEPDPGEKNYILKEFYKNGVDRTLGKVSAFKPSLVYEDTLISFYADGKKRSVVNYKNGKKLGMAFEFFKNGEVKKQKEYLPRNTGDKTQTYINEDAKVLYQADSLGKVLVKDGNGHAVDFEVEKDDVFIEEGGYKDGFKQGTWTGKYQSGKSNYNETYNLGKLVSGIKTIGDKKYEYTDLGSPPSFRGGINQFYKYLSNSIRFPKDAMERGIKGKVLISFTIEKDGKITEAKIEKGVNPSIDQEALRVIRASPDWIPGIQRGAYVKVKYNIPISFN
ncbi:MAG: TonB family protein [Pedobacter sp.]|nr:MAG: TonB family protein [Pedobacter sp.]